MRRNSKYNVSITDFGTYVLDREINGRTAQGISVGTATNVQHTATEGAVPAEIGVSSCASALTAGTPADRVNRLNYRGACVGSMRPI